MKRKFFGLLIVFLLGFVIGCNEYDENGLDADLQKSGTVVFRITDAPFPSDSVAEANITIDWIKLLKDDGESEEEIDNGENGEENGENGENDNGNDEENGENGDENNPSSVLIELKEEITINLLDLSNGKTSVLTEADVPEGIYREIRLHVVEAGIMLNDGTTFDLKVPSGDASGLKIKINPPLDVEKETVSEVLLDFDVSRSFVLRGNMKHGYDKVVGFIFKPVVRAVATLESSEISGVVSAPDTLIENAFLVLLSGNDTVTTALTDDKGYYKMIGILSGDYSLACEAGGYQKQVIDMELGIGESKEQNFELVEESEESTE
jgi:hypothetical protein